MQRHGGGRVGGVWPIFISYFFIFRGLHTLSHLFCTTAGWVTRRRQKLPGYFHRGREGRGLAITGD